MYDPYQALANIDHHTATIMACLLLTVFGAFGYFFIALRMAIRQQVYVVPFIGSAIFFWHDFTFALMYHTWFHVYDHWWVKMWWYALCGTVVLELVMLYQVFRYGHKELWPNVSRGVFGLLIIAGTLGAGAMWWLVKTSIGDPLFFITFAITAVFSVPFHTGLMVRRKSRAGQSVAMEALVVLMIGSLSLAFMQIAPFFRSPVYLTFVGVFIIWPLVNIALILRYPPLNDTAVRQPDRDALLGSSQPAH